MKGRRLLGIVLTLLGLAISILRIVFESTIIVSFGIHIAKLLTAVAGLTMGYGIGSFALSFAPAVGKRFRLKRLNKLLQAKIESERESTNDYEADSLNPEKVRIRLEQLKARNHNLEPLMDKCISQKDEIDRYQEQLNRLIKANEAIYLNDIPGVLDSAERRMCANFRDIINCCILVEYNDEGIRESNQDIILDALRSNKDELQSVSVLLDRSVAYINDYNRKGIGDRSELDAWIKAMEEKINKKGALKFE